MANSRVHPSQYLPIKPKFLHRLLDLQEAGGIPIQQSLDNALEEFIACCVEPRMEALLRPSESRRLAVVLQFPQPMQSSEVAR